MQQVNGETDEPEVLFIGNAVVTEEGEQWEKVARESKHRARLREMPPRLERKTVKGFKVLEEDDYDDAEEVCNIWAVENNAGDVSAGKKLGIEKKSWASLGIGEVVVDSAAEESCWPKGHGDAFETKPSKKNIILRTANGGEMGHYGGKEITVRKGADDEVVGLNSRWRM